MKELDELNDALRGLRDKVEESTKLSWEALTKMHKVVNESNLKGTMQLLASDIMLKRLLDNAHYHHKESR